jgi:hypothetical protein
VNSGPAGYARIIISRASFVYILFVVSCSPQGESGQQDPVLAVAGTQSLTVPEFQQRYLPQGGKDSAALSRRLIEEWATEALLYQEAGANLQRDEMDVERQVSDYRQALVNHVYETRLVEANLDTSITEPEISAYYNEHKASFILKENIVKVNYVKVPLKAPGYEKISKLISSPKPKDVEQLQKLLSQNAENYFMNDSTWLRLDDIRKEVPALRDQPDLSITAGKLLEFTDRTYYYYLKVKDVKVKNSLSPLTFERQNIRKFIINNRKTQLIGRYKRLLLDNARSNKTFTIF